MTKNSCYHVLVIWVGLSVGSNKGSESLANLREVLGRREGGRVRERDMALMKESGSRRSMALIIGDLHGL